MKCRSPSTRLLRDLEDAITVFPLKTADDVIDQMPKIISQFDIVVADGPVGLSEVTRALLLMTDLALLPCGPSALDLRAAQVAIRVVQQAQMIRKGPPKTFLLPNKVQSNYRLSRELLETADSLGIPSLKSTGVAPGVCRCGGPRDRGLAVAWNQRGRRRNQRVIQSDRPV